MIGKICKFKSGDTYAERVKVLGLFSVFATAYEVEVIGENHNIPNDWCNKNVPGVVFPAWDFCLTIIENEVKDDNIDITMEEWAAIALV